MAAISRSAIALGLMLALSGSAVADEAASGVTRERKALMSEMAAAMKRTLFALGADAPGDGNVAADARTLVLHAGEIERLFPEGSLEPPSGASPEIWQRWDDFRALAQQAADRADALLRAVEFGERDTAMRRFAALGRSCIACHARFRASGDPDE